MTETFGVTMLVASNRPPKPTSNTAAFIPYFANAKNANAVVISKVVNFSIFATCWLDLVYQFNQLLMRDRRTVDLNPLHVIFQVRRHVYKPVVYPAARKADAQSAEVDPFPFLSQPHG